MPKLDIDRAHGDVAMRLLGSHQISYILVGREEAVGLPIPALLRGLCIRVTAGLPKSGLQVLDPQWYQRHHLERNLPQPVRFAVVFDKNFAAWSPAMAEEPALIHVLYWATQKPAALRALAQVQSQLLVVPLSQSVENDLLNAGLNRCDIAQDPDAIYDRIEQEIISNIHSGSTREFEDRIATHRRIAEEWRDHVLPGLQRPFNPLDVNRNQLRQLLGQFRSHFWQFEKEDQHAGRATAQVSTFRSVSATAIAIAANGDARTVHPPPAIFAFPSISPFLKRQLESRVDKADKQFKPTLKELVAMRLQEQDSSTFMFQIPGNKKELTLGALEIIVPDVASYTRFFDDVGYLHASFQASPYLRGALKGKSLAQHHSFFAPGTFPTAAKPQAIVRKIAAFSDALAGALERQMHRTISTYPGAIVGLSDLPVEWLTDRRVPLCFSHDVCRIPETAATNMLSHFNLNSHFAFQIDSTTPAKTLVVCGAVTGDPIEQSFRLLRSFWRDKGAPWRWEHCTSLSQLYAVVDEFRPQLLIFDTHGRFRDNDSGSELQIGADFLTGDNVIENLPGVPLVILSTCWGAPLYGCPNTIAHAFFENGTFAVTSSMLPISGLKGALLYSRVLGNLRYACEHPIHANWSAFMSHNVRTSYFDDLKEKILGKYSHKVIDPELYRARRADWQTQSMFQRTRRLAFFRAPRLVTDCFEKDIATNAKNILAAQTFIPEFMYYSTMGRADLVQFASWNAKHYTPADRLPTIAELRASHTNSGEMPHRL